MEVLVVWEVWEVYWILKGFWLCQCFCWVMDPWYKCELLSFAWWCRVLHYLSIIVKSLSSTFGYFVEMWWFLIALVVWFLYSETFSFRYLLVSPIYSAVQLLAFPVVDYISFLWIWNWIFWMHEWGLDGAGTFKENSNPVFSRVCLYCSLRPMIYGMTILAPSMNFTMDGFDFLLALYWGLPCWKNCVG